MGRRVKQVAGKVQFSQVGRRSRYVQCNVTLEIFKEDKGGMFSPKWMSFRKFFKGGGVIFDITMLGIKDFFWHSNVELIFTAGVCVFLNLFYHSASMLHMWFSLAAGWI